VQLHPRLLTYQPGSSSDGTTDGWTVENCLATCQANSVNNGDGFQYAGLQNGDECWCSNGLPPRQAPDTSGNIQGGIRPGPVEDTSANQDTCNKACNGDQTVTIGPNSITWDMVSNCITDYLRWCRCGQLVFTKGTFNFFNCALFCSALLCSVFFFRFRVSIPPPGGGRITGPRHWILSMTFLDFADSGVS